jgi:heme/copper-type cytochrome/quinol oxidase subunit 2
LRPNAVAAGVRNATRSCRLNKRRTECDVKQADLAWSVPVMRVGYAGRGLVYLTVAGFSLYAIWRGEQPQETASTLSQLETTGWGSMVLLLIFLGTLAFTVWNVIVALYRLEKGGADGEGIVARAGKIITALIYGGVGGTAFSLLFAGGRRGDDSSIANWTAAVMGWPGGRWLVGLAGLTVVGAGVVFLVNAWKEKYREHLQANRFTRDWNWLLKAGVVAHGVVTALIGILFVQAAWRVDPKKAGGIGKAFSWLVNQPYGQVLVAAICVGLIAFALFSFVNAGYRVIPKVSGGDIETLAARLVSKVRQAT